MSLEYEAPDIYPAGVKLERVLTLPGDQNIVIEDTMVTPKSVPARPGICPRELAFIPES